MISVKAAAAGILGLGYSIDAGEESVSHKIDLSRAYHHLSAAARYTDDRQGASNPMGHYPSLGELQKQVAALKAQATTEKRWHLEERLSLALSALGSS